MDAGRDGEEVGKDENRGWCSGEKEMGLGMLAMRESEEAWFGMIMGMGIGFGGEDLRVGSWVGNGEIVIAVNGEKVWIAGEWSSGK